MSCDGNEKEPVDAIFGIHLRNRRRYWELRVKAEDRKNMETTVYQSNISIFHKSLDLLISSILNNNNNNNNNNNLQHLSVQYAMRYFCGEAARRPGR